MLVSCDGFMIAWTDIEYFPHSVPRQAALRDVEKDLNLTPRNIAALRLPLVCMASQGVHCEARGSYYASGDIEELVY